MVRIDSWHTTTPHQIQQMTYMYSCNNVAHSSDFFFVFVFFMGRRECQLKKSRRGLHSILQLQMTLSGLRMTGEDDVSSPKYKAVNQSSNRHPWLALILSIGYRMRWFRTSYCLTSLVYVHNCLIVCFRCALIIYMYFCYLNLFICA